MPNFQSLEECQQIVENDLKKIPDNYKNFTDKTRNDKNINPWKRMVVGILTCKRTVKRLDNFLMIYREIFEKLGLDYYIIVADPDIETKLDFVVNDETRIFMAKAKESYETLAHKVAIFYSYINNFTEYDYVIKVNDGCLLDLSKVLGKLDSPYIGSILKPTSNKTKFIFHHKLKEIYPNMNTELYNIRYAGGGYGYRINRKLIKIIDKYKHHILSLDISCEDILFGQIFYLEGVCVVYHSIGRYDYIESNNNNNNNKNKLY